MCRCGANDMDLYYQDDNSGRQKWVFTPVLPGSANYFITSYNGLSCGQTYVAPQGLCAANTNLLQFSGPQITADMLQVLGGPKF